MSRFTRGCLAGCGILVVLIIAAVVGGVSWFRATFMGPPPAAPPIGATVALRPTILLREGGEFSAGTGVAVRMAPSAAPILLTALHLFGPAGGLEQNVAPADLDRVVREVQLRPIAGGKVVARARGALVRKGAALTDENSNASRDLAAFKLLPKAKVNALPLAAANPRAGEWVWLVGDVVDHEPQTQRLFPGKVMFSADDGTIVRFQPAFQLMAFSGAPLINSRKEVVGLLISGQEAGGVGILHPAGSIRKRLAENGVR